ncbi:MAG: hypothetical protein WCQ99_06950, partial [Pseudomonadota bacterium]
MEARRTLQKRLEKYVARTVLPFFSCSGSRFTLTGTNLGIHSHVFYLDIEGRPPLVLKGIQKKDRFKA